MPYAVVERAWPRGLVVAGLALGALALLLSLGAPAAALGEAVEVLDGHEHVLEGEAFSFRVVAGLGDDTETVRVSCSRCGGGWTAAIGANQWDPQRTAANQRQKTLTFPSTQFPGSAGQPKWAENYTISVLDPAASAAANVTVHLFDAWRQTNSTYEASGKVRFQVGGLASGNHAYINISKYTSRGALVSVANLQALALNGKATLDWRIPREHAADMDCPQYQGRCQNYTIRVTAPGKVESAELRAQPARLNASIGYVLSDLPGGGLPLPGSGLAFNRTENLTVTVDVRYHDNRPLTAADRTRAGNATLNGTLELAVERIVAAPGSPGAAPERVATLWARDLGNGKWRSTWHIPRNASETLPGAEYPQYRVRLVPQHDLWTNLVPETNGTAFQVHKLRLKPQWLADPAQDVERLTNATAVFRLRYADGTPFTDEHNRTRMRARLVDVNGDAQDDARIEHLGNGTWRMWYKPDLGFDPLGWYKLRLDENEDNVSNPVVRSESAPFRIVPAQPRIELVTKVNHVPRNETEGFSRGEWVQAEALIRYADGTPFNKTRLPSPNNGSIIVNITKVGEDGIPRGTFPLYLVIDREDGLWANAFPIENLTDENPVGPWAWRFDLRDHERPAPNRNDTTFTRWVHGATLGLQVLQQPEPLVRAGERLTAKFQARYPDGGVLDEARAQGGIVVLVHPWREGAPGDPVARLYPFYNTTRAEWAVQWQTNRTTLVGEYVFTIQGSDRVGNRLPVTTTAPAKVFVERIERQVLRDPPGEVRRGETVLVLFDGHEGDLGEEGHDAPRIEVQRWNAARKAWEKERTDVRDPGAAGDDHLGRFVTSNTTSLGLYRFALFARNDQHARVNATSAEFRVVPVELERAWFPQALEATARPVVKGVQLTLPLERRDGDLVDGAAITLDGQRVGNATAVQRAGRYDVVWRTAYTLGPGPYEVVVRGRDASNNPFASPPLVVNFTGIEVDARVPAPPDGALARAERLALRVLVTYPDQQAVRTGAFNATFLVDGAVVAERAMVFDRGAWVLNWTPPPTAPLGEVRLLVSGDDGRGNTVRGLEVWSFELAEGVLKRTFTLQPNVGNRTQAVTWVLPADANDARMRFVLRDDAGGRRTLEHSLSKAGDYVVTWRPAKDERLGRYTLEAQGADQDGNALLAGARSLLLQPAPIGITFLERVGPPTGPGKVKPGDVASWTFQLKFADGTVIAPSAEVLPLVGIVQGANIIDRPQLAISTDGKAWVATWKTIPGQHAGVYRFVVAGQDSLGNVAQGNQDQFSIDEGVLKEILGVPGFEAALLPLALLGAALLGRERRPR